jgi:hypothetical protein
MAHDRGATRAGSSKSRSRVTNGSKMLPGVDGRSAAARRFRDLVGRLRDLGGTLTTAEDALIRLAALVTLRAEQLQADPLNGVTVATDDMAHLAGS